MANRLLLGVLLLCCAPTVPWAAAINVGAFGSAGFAIPKEHEKLDDESSNSRYYAGTSWTGGFYWERSIRDLFFVKVDLRSQYLSYEAQFRNDLTWTETTYSWYNTSIGLTFKYEKKCLPEFSLFPALGIGIAKFDGWRIKDDLEPVDPNGFRFDFPYYAPLLKAGLGVQYKRFGLEISYSHMPTRWAEWENYLNPYIDDLSLLVSYRIWGTSGK